jgi:hypothetical protein
VIRFFNTSRILPGRAVVKSPVCPKTAALCLAYTSGPAPGPRQGEHTVALKPRIFSERRMAEALDILFDPGGWMGGWEDERGSGLA